MRRTFTRFKFLALCAACVVSAAAQGQITKCIDEAGRVSYSDDACVNGVVVGYLDVETPATAPVSREPRRSTPMALENAPARETAWALMPPVQRHALKDVATVSAARTALAEMDRGLAAVRTQKLASSR